MGRLGRWGRSSTARRSRRAAPSGSAAARIAEITAIPLAPVESTSLTLEASMPPTASTGTSTDSTIRASSLTPRGGSPGLEAVG